MTKRLLAHSLFAILLVALAACAAPTPAPTVSATATPTGPNLDAETLGLVSHADRTVFIVPFSHWDTDWHETFSSYVQRSDGNILSAIQMAKKDAHFRYTLEQTLFVQHFWDTHPEARADLKTLVQNRQITFAWPGITQPETSLASPAIQVRNLQMGEDWIASTFGSAYVPHTAWQSDAFGNSAAFPLFLNQFQIPYLFIGRSIGRCAPGAADCQTLPYAFYWRTPLSTARVLAVYLNYPTAWDGIHMLPNQAEQLAALGKIVDSQFQRTTSKYLLLPMGSDFIDPLPNVASLVDQWNAENRSTVLVMSDPATAFGYLATQNLPEIDVDMNPIWQAFYATRPEAKIADKESDYYLTAADKFGLVTGAPSPAAWQAAAMNIHYDNIGAVSFDQVWETAQRPRFEQTVASAADDLAGILAHLAAAVPAPRVTFNPSSWPRSEVVELAGTVPDAGNAAGPIQQLGPDHIAYYAGAVPPIGYSAAGAAAAPVRNPAAASQSAGQVTLTNGLVSVTLDPAHGATFSSLKQGDHEFVSGPADDVVYFEDRGDVYGAFFGNEKARSSAVPAQITLLAQGPLLARAQAVVQVGGQPITKTVTIQADNPRVDVRLDIKALPQTTAMVQTSTTITTETRTDDLGLAPLTHTVDPRPIAPGDVTYRRKIFYPIISWSDVSAGGWGMALITHGLQGIAGTSTLSLMLVRDVTERDEGVTDLAYHTLDYAYLPHAAGPVSRIARAADEFNQPLIPAWRAGNQVVVQVPFDTRPHAFAADAVRGASQQPASYSLLSADNGNIADLFRRGDQVEAIVLNGEPDLPVQIQPAGQVAPLRGFLNLVPVPLK